MMRKREMKRLKKRRYILIILILMIFINIGCIKVQAKNETWVKTREITINRNNQVISTKEYEYDKKGREIRYTYHSEDDYVYEYINDYDKNGNLIRQTYTDENGENGDYTEYKYINHQLVREIHYFGFEDSSTIEYKYTKRGQRQQAVEYFADDGSERVTEYEYDAKGRIINEITSDSSGIVSTHKYKYESKKCTEYIMYDFGDYEENVICTTQFNKKGQVIRKENHSDYSDNGNWVQEFSYDKNGNNSEIIEYDRDMNFLSKTTLEYIRL